MRDKTFTALVTGRVVLISKKPQTFRTEGVKDENEALKKAVKEIQASLPQFDVATNQMEVRLLPGNNGNHKKRKKPPYVNNNGRHRR